ncbi:hypothetical protein C5167_047013 [Papaver somniferum]|uniref:PI31 proteasome regulator N-terminal domain-containing protein n=1 Tax=Papaver somniferum TaxID=3469 RepID=A0A4Y7LJ09_PAPSO|nr:probable proteasome inhibitor [Papaver somniferum]RZC84231.1 hypothetical protein C5167_047013 [Papaver somniferum]
MASGEGVMAVIRATRPNFRNAHDKVAFAVHAMFLNAGYLLTATGSQAFSDTILTSPPSDEVGIEGWNQSEDSYGFVYLNTDKGVKYTVLVKCLVMGDFLVIDSMSSKYPDKEPLSLQINVNDYNGGDERTNFASQFKNFDELVKKLNLEILSKLEDTPKPTGNSSSSPPSSTVPPVASGIVDDRVGYIGPPVAPGIFDDRLPGPGAGFYPRHPDIGGGPMLIGPNDPRWFRPAGGHPDRPDLLGPLGIPPGARFDPYGPPEVPGFEPNRFGGNPRRPSGPHPDLAPFGDPDYI